MRRHLKYRGTAEPDEDVVDWAQGWQPKLRGITSTAVLSLNCCAMTGGGCISTIASWPARLLPMERAYVCLGHSF